MTTINERLCHTFIEREFFNFFRQLQPATLSTQPESGSAVVSKSFDACTTLDYSNWMLVERRRQVLLLCQKGSWGIVTCGLAIPSGCPLNEKRHRRGRKSLSEGKAVLS